MQKQKKTDDAADESMLHQLLSCLTDTEAELQEPQHQLQHCTTEAAGNGGNRHPTSVISTRLLAVLARKSVLLHDVEAQRVSFEAAHARREEFFFALIANPDTYKPPPELCDLRKFVNSYTHSPGNPSDANKSDFGTFVANMKLPYRHVALQYLRDLANVAGEWWADACLRQASEGAGHGILRPLFDVAMHTGVERDHPKLARAMTILIDRLAEKVFEEADEHQKTDAALEAQGAVPPVGLASNRAVKIEASIAAAIKDGVPKGDARLQKAHGVIKTLHERDSLRKRMAGRMKRLQGN